MDHPRSHMRGTSFQVAFYDPTRGRRVYDRSFRNKHLAEEYARKLELHVNGAGPSPDLGGAFPIPASPASHSRLPWTETVDGWLERSAIRLAIRAWYGLVLRHFADIAGVKAVDDATDDTIAEFFSGIRRMGRSESTDAASPLVIPIQARESGLCVAYADRLRLAAAETAPGKLGPGLSMP